MVTVQWSSLSVSILNVQIWSSLSMLSLGSMGSIWSRGFSGSRCKESQPSLNKSCVGRDIFLLRGNGMWACAHAYQ